MYNEAVGRYENGEIIGVESYSSGETISDFSNFEPRFSATYVLNNRNSIKVSYNRLFQYLHLISNTNSPTPLDVWAPSGPFIEPQKVDQVAVGYFRNFKDNTYEASLEAYYKEMDNLVDYVDGADILTTNTLETEILPGSGRAYGLELYVKKNRGKLTGWVSYTLSRTERKVTGIGPDDPGINNGNYYAANYDKRNDLSVTAIYRLNDRWSLSSNFIYATGVPTTYPVGRYEYAGLVIPQFEDRNQQRLPDYHRLDVSATLRGKKQRWKRGGMNGCSASITFNNSANATSIYFIESEDNKGESKASRVTSLASPRVSRTTSNFKKTIMKKIKWIIAILSIGMVSCEKEADVTLPATPGRLIVEGRVEKIIGEEEYEQQVVLSLLNDFFDPSQTPRVEDAEVEVYDGLGNRYPYTPDPDVPGRYVNRELKGEVGQTYTLSIRWDGQEYEATETMVSVPPLDDVYQQFEEENAFEDGGLKLAIDFTDPAGEPNYYFWELYMDGENQIQPDPGTAEM